MRQGFIGIVILLGLAAGLGLGIAIGWLLPIRAPQTSPAKLSPMWQDDYILMTAQAYSLDGDLNTAQQRLKELLADSPTTPSAEGAEQTLGALVARRGQKAIEEGLPPESIGCLARLAAALGARPPELQPYLAR